jgi:hypothetical protein
LSLENLISSLKYHEKKFNSISLTSKEKSAKTLKTAKLVEEVLDGYSEDDSSLEKMADLTKILYYLTKKIRFQGKRSGSKGSSYKNRKEEHKGCFHCKKLGHFIVDCLELQKDKSKKESSRKEIYRKKLKKSLMAIWDKFDEELKREKKEDEEANLALMATTASDVESSSNSDDDDELFSKLTHEQFVDTVKEIVERCLDKSKALKIYRKI